MSEQLAAVLKNLDQTVDWDDKLTALEKSGRHRLRDQKTFNLGDAVRQTTLGDGERRAEL
jgi:hypothetical protein